MRQAMTTAILFLALFVPFSSFADIPPLNESVATMEKHTLPGHLVLMSFPDGTGHAFDQAVSDYDFSDQDATITLQVLDNNLTPIAGYPYEDIWLETSDDGLVACIGGTVADHNTLADGRTYWREPLEAGGSAGGDPAIRTHVVVNGEHLMNGVLPLWHNSPDIDRNGMINVTDVYLFSVDYFAYAANPADYAFRSDLEYDGAVNVADIVPLAQGQGHNCP